ncbi:MAG: 50S ribosomal protein L17 [Candidatus Omnitrophica bacterium]|nr:50S ribosomal protein L17 [Candidatus Omnitrophota bacterium]
MRHRKKHRRLSRFGSSRKALLRSMARAFFSCEKITTTLTKAKESRRIFDELIKLGKKNDFNSKRSAFRILQDRDLVDKLFKDIAPRFKDVDSGFTRIVHYKNRRGDGAPLAIIELTIQKPKEKKKMPPKKKKKATADLKREKEERLEKEISPQEAEKDKEVLPKKEVKPIQKEKEIKEIKKEEPAPALREEKPKSFLEGIRSLFKRKKDKKEL